MACEICTRATHEWYDCPKKSDGYVPIARRGGILNGAVAQIAAGHSLHGSVPGKGRSADLPSAKQPSPVYVGSNPTSSTNHQESTAARMDVPNVEADTFPDAIRILGCEAVAGGRDAAIAGSQAPPVDTTNRNANRHRPGYFADYQRQRRAKLKERK